jgi:hypothetical protein
MNSAISRLVWLVGFHFSYIPVGPFSVSGGKFQIGKSSGLKRDPDEPRKINYGRVFLKGIENAVRIS